MENISFRSKLYLSTYVSQFIVFIYFIYYNFNESNINIFIKIWISINSIILVIALCLIFICFSALFINFIIDALKYIHNQLGKIKD